MNSDKTPNALLCKQGFRGFIYIKFKHRLTDELH